MSRDGILEDEDMPQWTSKVTGHVGPSAGLSVRAKNPNNKNHVEEYGFASMWWENLAALEYCEE